MDRSEFFSLLLKKGIDPKIVSFNSSTAEGHNIRKAHHGWETFIRERGVEYDCIGFPSESDAMWAMFNELTKIYGKIP